MSWIKVSAINVFVLLGLIVVLELSWTVYDKIFKFNEKCELDWVLYNYCPNIKTTKLNNVNDGGQLIEIQVDELGGRMKIGSKSTLQKAHNFIIGDSFIQADEMPYDKTIYGIWNKQAENTAYGLGYSSWNPIQYFDAIKRIGKSNSHYYVFLMTNDVLPNYNRSVISENKNNNIVLRFLKKRNFYKISASFKEWILSFKRSITSQIENNPVKIISKEFTTQKVNDCSAISQLEGNNNISKLGFDYLVFSKKYDCWPEIHRKSFDEFSSIIEDIEKYVLTNLTSEITFVWVGAGWAHKNQNSISRQWVQYGFSPSISITQKGLVDAFRKRFTKNNILDTEEIISSDLTLCFEDCVDKYFYAIDGHWTPYTHSLILTKLNK